MWSKIESLLHKEGARTQETLLAAIGTALSKATPKEAANWFAHCGYVFVSNALVAPTAKSLDPCACGFDFLSNEVLGVLWNLVLR